MQTHLAATALILVLALPAPAQETGAPIADADDMAAMMAAWEAAMTPGPEHALLARTAGTWAMTMTIYGPPGTPPEVTEGTVERRMDMDGRIRIDRLSATMMGQPLSGMAVTGYDNVTGRYWSTWTDTMSTSVSVLWGEMDGGGGSLEGSYSEPMTGQRQPMRIETLMAGENRQTDSFFMPGPDGAMIKSMDVVYERQ